MKNPETPLETLSEIRALMERSSRFISLSGLSGVFAGFFALIGALVAYFYLEYDLSFQKSIYDANLSIRTEKLIFLLVDAGLVLILALSFGAYFTYRKARRLGLNMIDKTAYRLAENLLIPLVVGGIFCLVLIFRGQIGLVAPSTLIFYGLALLNGSKYTLDDVRGLGIMEIVLGLLALLFVGYGLIFWAIGFGVLHIWYGTKMYLKYEK
ncbi:MAG: hypothetical protein MUE85_07780 [Microscillaceae bacterium]|nr:hypothetical protein [Microscillaceae bacterium]